MASLIVGATQQKASLANFPIEFQTSSLLIMLNFPSSANQIQAVVDFQDLVSTPFVGGINALCWNRTLSGDFSEIVNKVALKENIAELHPEDLLALTLSAQGNLAREILINDLTLLKAQGASPTLNLIRCYERDESFFPTDVYSFHVDRSPVPTNTFLCTYYGESSEIIPNAQAEQKVLIPAIRAQLKELYGNEDAGFEAFLSNYFFDLHYQAKPNATTISLGVGNLWRLAVDHPSSKVLPCIHRAPNETSGKTRLLLIC